MGISQDITECFSTLGKQGGKLCTSFAKAAPEVVAREQQKRHDAETRRQHLIEQLSALG